MKQTLLRKFIRSLVIESWENERSTIVPDVYPELESELYNSLEEPEERQTVIPPKQNDKKYDEI